MHTITFTRHRADGGTEPLTNSRGFALELPATVGQNVIDELAEEFLNEPETLRIVAQIGNQRLTYQ